LEALAFRLIASVVNPVIKMELEKKYKLSPDKISIIPNGANIELFKPIDKHIAKKKLGMDIDKKYVCFVETFEESSNPAIDGTDANSLLSTSISFSSEDIMAFIAPLSLICLTIWRVSTSDIPIRLFDAKYS